MPRGKGPESERTYQKGLFSRLAKDLMFHHKSAEKQSTHAPMAEWESCGECRHI